MKHLFIYFDVTVLEVLKFQVAYVPLVEEGSSHDVVQMSDGFDDDFDDDFAVHSLCSCGPGAFGAICSFSSCRQGAFGCRLQFQLMQARSICCHLLCSCGQGALVVAF